MSDLPLIGTIEDDVLYGDQLETEVITHVFSNPYLPPPGEVIPTDISPDYKTTATLHFVKSNAGYKNTLGHYSVAEDRTITGVHVAFENAQSTNEGESYSFDVEKEEKIGLFVIANGFNLNKNYKNFDFENGDLSFIYHFGKKDQRPATIDDHGKDISLVYSLDGKTTVLKGNTYHTNFGDTQPTINVDGKVHTQSDLAFDDDPGTLRIGFEDLKNLGDADFNDLIVDLTYSEQTVLVSPSSYDDLIEGLEGNDIIFGGLGDDQLYGHADNDTLNGEDGADNLFGGSGEDVLNGGADNDRLYGGNHNDTLNGDDGNDKLFGQSGSDILNGGSGDDQLYGDYGDDILNGDEGDDLLYGGVGDDTLRGGLGIDVLYGEQGADELDGGEGDDILYGGNSHDTINGGEGNDLIYGDLVDGPEDYIGNDILHGDAGDDYVYGHGGDDFITGDEGNDNLSGGEGNDTIYGGDGDDYILGQSEKDTLYGDDGEDRLYGGGDNDILYGGNDADKLFGEFGSDLLYGDGGDDLLYGGNGDDLINGGEGNDTLYGDLFLSTEDYTGNDVMNGGDGDDHLYGHGGDDILNGDSGDDNLYGHEGNDVLRGGEGSDWLEGDSGDDILSGGAGRDVLYGGAGKDTFVFDQFDGSSDQIRDFTYGGSEGDRLNITDILSGYEEGVSDMSDFVEVQFVNNNYVNLKVNTDGVGDDFRTIGKIFGSDFSNASAQDLLDDGTLVVNNSIL